MPLAADGFEGGPQPQSRKSGTSSGKEFKKKGTQQSISGAARQHNGGGISLLLVFL